MSKIISVGILIAVVFVGWRLFEYWESVRDERESKQAAVKVVTHGDQLAGMPAQAEASLQAARNAGVNSFRKWLETYGPSLQDPRKAWIELDFCVAVSRDNPKEARQVFAGVQKRLRPDSPVYPRLKQLEPTYGQ